MNLHLVDADPDVASALRDAFDPFPEVNVGHGDLLAVAHNAVVSPANSHGFMDGGIDHAYRVFFGEQLERRVRDAIGRRPEGHLPIGAALTVGTGHAVIPYLIVAPTMLMPESADPMNCYRAFRAVLRLAGSTPELARAVYSPGLGTGVGRVTPQVAAREMALAYADWECASQENRPQPAFAIGQRVRVVVNERNRTPHTGAIRDFRWHHKDQRYHYYLEENGKIVSKRYSEEDLEGTPATD